MHQVLPPPFHIVDDSDYWNLAKLFIHCQIGDCKRTFVNLGGDIQTRLVDHLHRNHLKQSGELATMKIRELLKEPEDRTEANLVIVLARTLIINQNSPYWEFYKPIIHCTIDRCLRTFATLDMMPSKISDHIKSRHANNSEASTILSSIEDSTAYDGDHSGYESSASIEI